MTTTVTVSVPTSADYIVRVTLRTGDDKQEHVVKAGESPIFYVYDDVELSLKEFVQVPDAIQHHPV